MATRHVPSTLPPFLLPRPLSYPYRSLSTLPLPSLYRKVYESTTRLDLDPQRLVMGKGDFAAALNKVVPASRRGVAGSPARPLNSIATPLLEGSLERIMQNIRSVLPAGNGVVESVATASSSSSPGIKVQDLSYEDDSDRRARRIKDGRDALDSMSHEGELWIAALTDMQDDKALHSFFCVDSTDKTDSTQAATSSSSSSSHDSSASYGENNSSLWDTACVTSRPRLMIAGGPDMGQGDLVAAVLQQLDGVPCFAIDHPSLLADLNAHSPEQALVNRVQEACRAAPSVIYLPQVTRWWAAAPESMRAALMTLVDAMPASLPVLWLSTLTVGKSAEHIRQGMSHTRIVNC